MSKISDQLNGLTSAIATSAPHPPPINPSSPGVDFPSGEIDTALIPLPPEVRKEPSLPVPRVYEGDLSKCRGFVAQCEFLFIHQPSRFTSDEARIALIVSLLGGRALDWAVAIFF